jgi:hypothetical protein
MLNQVTHDGHCMNSTILSKKINSTAKAKSFYAFAFQRKTGL